MYRWKIVQASILLILTLACGWIHTPLETVGTQDSALVQIGYFHSIYLRYDTSVWEKVNRSPDQLQNDKGEPVEALQHREIAGCVLHDNLGRGAPPSWERLISKRVIGSLEYQVEFWTDTETQEPVLVVYQYPVGESGNDTRIELVVDQEPEDCIKSAEDILALSSDLISER